MKVTDYILSMDVEIINEVKARLNEVGLDDGMIDDALNSRLCDLSETININDLI